MKLGGRVQYGPRKNSLHFWADLKHSRYTNEVPFWLTMRDWAPVLHLLSVIGKMIYFNGMNN